MHEVKWEAILLSPHATSKNVTSPCDALPVFVIIREYQSTIQTYDLFEYTQRKCCFYCAVLRASQTPGQVIHQEVVQNNLICFASVSQSSTTF